MRKKIFQLLLILVIITVSLWSIDKQILSPTKSQGVNILENGNFSNGWTGWKHPPVFSLQSSISMSGDAAKLDGNGSIDQRWINLSAGDYKLIGWMRIDSTTGGSWGGVRAEITNESWQTLVTTGYLTTSDVTPGEWFDISLNFTLTSQTNIGVSLGSHSDRSFEAYFDKFTLSESTTDLPPTVNPSSDISSGTAPLTVQFLAKAIDHDGIIDAYHWDFDDGGYDIISDPTYTFFSKGIYTVRLTVYDDNGNVANGTLSINVEDPEAPTINITTQVTSTPDSSINISGNVSDDGQVTSIVWDNINNGQSGTIQNPNDSWTVSDIPLKPGNNEILVTATDNDSFIDTDKIDVYREINNPTISNIQVNSNSVNMYEKLEIKFDLETVADYYFFPYEPSNRSGLDPLPLGVDPEIGVTVEGIFTSPSGEQIIQPGFFINDVELTSDWQGGYYTESTTNNWMVRLSPRETGNWSFSIKAQDASGITTETGNSFTVNPPTRNGFIKVSQDDTRYFEFSDGTPYYPLGPIDDDYNLNNTYGMNLARPWMGTSGAYSTNWARWASSSEQSGNEGFMAKLDFKHHYPSHELSKVLFMPNGKNFFLGFGDDRFRARLTAGTTYYVKVRLKTQNIQGPVNSGPYGFMIKTSGWAPDGDWNNVGETLRDRDSFIPEINTNKGWHTITAEYTAQDFDSDHRGTYINLFLDNVSEGQVYIDEFSMRPILPDDSLGGELIRNPLADMHTYVEQRPARYFDNQVESGEQNDVFFKYIVQDKNDWIPNHLDSNGLFTDNGDGYYQPNGTRNRWIQNAWWRYIIARWGYSTAIHSWELNNEGSPDSTKHYSASQDFSKFMHDNDYHLHLATTSFWSDWRPNFWSDNTNYPDVDYSDVHQYIDTNDASSYDITQWIYDNSQSYYQDQVGKPIQIGETGIQEQYAGYISDQTDPTWWHNFIWVGINHTGVSYPTYWYPSHLDQINYYEEIGRFTSYIKDIPLNKGFYQDAQAVVSNSNLRAFGQKDTVNGGLHLWIQNKNNTWKNKMDGVAISPQSGTITIGGFNPGDSFVVEYWDTWQGQISNTQTHTVNGSRELIFQIDNLTTDTAIRLLPEGTVVRNGDVDHDGDVDKDDSLMILSNYLINSGELSGTYWDPVQDGIINIVDFGWTVNDWGR